MLNSKQFNAADKIQSLHKKLESRGSGYLYTEAPNVHFDRVVIATHPRDGVVGGLAWDPSDGTIRNWDVHPNHRNGIVATGLLNKALEVSKVSGIEAPDGSHSLTPASYRVTKNLAPEKLSEYKVTEGHLDDEHEDDLTKYTDPKYDHWSNEHDVEPEKD